MIENLLENRCMKTEVNVGGPSPASTLYAENSFGNIYVNKISMKGAFPDENDSVGNQILFNKIKMGGNVLNNTQSYINLSS